MILREFNSRRFFVFVVRFRFPNQKTSEFFPGFRWVTEGVTGVYIGEKGSLEGVDQLRRIEEEHLKSNC